MTGDTIFYGSYSSIDPEIRDGIFKIYENGNLLYIKEYSNNKLNGNVFSFYNYGSIKCKRIYSNDSLISSKCFDEHDKEIPNIIDIVMPKFNNSGMNEFKKYVQTNLLYPQEAKSYGLSGRVLVEFKIDKKGYVKDIKIIESDNNIFNKEAIRVILTSSGMWIPGQRYGEPYEVKFVFPVIFIY